MIDKIEIEHIEDKPQCSASYYKVGIISNDKTKKKFASNFMGILNILSNEFGFEIESITYKPKE